VEHSLIPGKTVGADLSRTPPIYRPNVELTILGLFCETSLSALVLIHTFPECTTKVIDFPSITQ